MSTHRAMDFPISTALIVSHTFGYVVSLFLLNSRKTLISFFISSLTQWWFSSWLFSFHKFVGFLKAELLLKSNFISWWSNKTQVVTDFFLYLWKFFSYRVWCQFLRRFHEMLRRRYILSYLGGMFYRYLLSPFGSIPPLILLFLC